MIEDNGNIHMHPQVLDLWDHLKENPIELLKFISKTHAVVFEDQYRNLELEGTSEFMTKAVPEIKAFFESAPKQIQGE